jgi:RimJ/RimL family protein N-acetyltransferase
MRLADGRTVQIRPLTSADGDALIDAIAGADSFDLYRRFMGSPPAPHVLVRLLGAADGVHDAVLGAFDGATLVGVAQFDRGDDEPTAELAIEVATAWKRCGLGAAMLRALAGLAASCGITTLTAVYFADNAALCHLLQATGASRWTGSEGGASSAELDLRKLAAMSAAAMSAAPSS